MKHRWLVLTSLAACAGSEIGERTSALSTEVVISDPAGDVVKQWPGWMDLVGGAIRLEDGVYTFTWRLAADIPAKFEASSQGAKYWVWVYHLDTDSTTAPAGLPLNQNQPLRSELVVVVTGEGSSIRADLYDRRPLLDGGTWIITPLELVVGGAELEVTVPSSMLGDPQTFSFAERTANWTTRTGDGAHPLDSGGDWADWPTFP